MYIETKGMHESVTREGAIGRSMSAHSCRNGKKPALVCLMILSAKVEGE